MEEFRKIEKPMLYNVKEINDDTQNGCICVLFNIERPFEIGERDEIATFVENKFTNHIFTGKNDFTTGNKDLIEYKFYYKK